jgi:hypothetical protein
VNHVARPIALEATAARPTTTGTRRLGSRPSYPVAFSVPTMPCASWYLQKKS